MVTCVQLDDASFNVGTVHYTTNKESNFNKHKFKKSKMNNLITIIGIGNTIT